MTEREPQALHGVSKTAILTLRARADEHARRDRLFEDPFAEKWIRLAEWPVELNFWYSPRVQSFLAFRAHELDRLLTEFSGNTPDVAVIELGAGLSSRYLRIGAPRGLRWMDLDLPEVIALREKLGVIGDRHRHLARSVLDRAWIEEAARFTAPAETTFIIAEGLLYYLPRADVDALFAALARSFPGAIIAFDLLGAMDWKATLERSKAAGTPIAWMYEAPFEHAWTDFGLDVVPGWEPHTLMNTAIDLYWPRFGRAEYLAIKFFAGFETLAGRRSGTVAGRLRQPHV